MAQPWEQDWSANRQDAASETAKPWERDWGASAAPVKARQDGQMVSGFKRSFQEVPGMLAGVGAYAADLVGADAARDSMLGYAKRKQEEVGAAHANDAQSITDAWDGKVGWMDFLANASGYVAGQALQSIATGGLGALGAKMVAKQGAKELAEAAAAKAIAAGASEQLAQKAAADAVVGSINRAMKIGGVAGAMSHNFSMELGSIYPDAVEQAEKEGRTLDGGDKFRVFAAASLAAGVDTAGEAIMAGRMLKGSASPSASILGRAAREVPAGMVREAGTEAVQTGIEQWGAARALDVREIVDSAGVGAIGGGLGGGVSSLNRREEAAKPKLGAGDVLAAPTVDDAINTATLAIAGPVAKPQWEVVDGALALPAPARQEPAGLLKALPAPDGGTVYMADSQGNVAPQPAEARTEALNRDTEARLQAEALAQAERMQRELLGKQTPRGEEVPERVPVGEATEFQPIPAGETSEAIPTGEATELEPIPAGEATELSPETILADDLLARDGQPFGSKTGAQAKAYASGGGTVVAIPDHFGSGQPGYVVRQLVPAQPNNTRGTNAADLAGTAGQRPADAGGSAGAGRVRDSQPTDVLASPASAAGQGMDGAGAAGGGTTGAAPLTTGDRITLAGKSYFVAAVTGTAVKLDDGAGGVRTVAKGSKTYGQITKDDAQQATATRTEETAPTSAAATLGSEAAPIAAVPSAKEYLSQVEQARSQAADRAKDAPRETITPAEDAIIGKNEAGEALYERKNGDRYRLRDGTGRPDFGGDLSPSANRGAEDATAAASNTKPRVFKNKDAATKARRELGNTHKVQKVKGGFILRQMTDKELAAAAKAGRRATSHTVDTGTDTLLKAVAKLGGLDRAGSSRDLGIAPEDFKHASGLIGAPTFRVTGGQSPERMLEALKDHHYLPQDAGLRDLEDAIGNELRGRPQYSMAVDAEAALGEDAFSQPDEDFEPLADLTPDDLDAEGYTSASPEVQALTESLLADAAAQQIDTEAIAETVAMQADGLTQDQYHAAFQAAIREAVAAHQSTAGAGNAEAAGRGSEDRGRADGTEGGSQEGADQGLTLEAQTAEDLKAKVDREAAATASEHAKKAAEQERLRREAEARDIKARADQTVDDFQLGQSAEQQMSGMGDMFADPPAPAPAEDPRELGRQAARDGKPRMPPDAMGNFDRQAWRAGWDQAKKTPGPTPQLPTPQQMASFIGIAADNIGKLRASDVDRVISEAPAIYRVAVAGYIRDNRPDLAQDVADSLEDLRATPATVAQPAITPDQAANMRRGDIVRDSSGTEFYAWSARFGRIDVMPLKDGKPVVNNSSAIRFALDDTTKAANPEYRTDPLYLVRSVPAEAGPATATNPQAEQTGDSRDDSPQLTEAQARKQFEWRNAGQSGGTKTHLLFFYVAPEDKGTGRAMGRGYVELYDGSSGWRVDGEGQSYKALADAKKAAIEAAIPVLREQGWIAPAAAEPAAQAAAILDAAAEPPKGAERLSVIKDVKAGAITPDEVAAAYPAAEPAEPAEKPKAAEPGKVDNFGEALPPARRAMAAKLDEELADSDIANRPLSEIWPLAENDAIEDTFAAAVAHAARAEIPAKPRVAYKVKQWVQKVKAVRGLAAHVLSGRLTRDRLRDEVGQKYSLRDWATKVFLLEQLPRGQWKRIGAVEERPDAYTYDDKSNRIPTPSLRIVIDDKPHYLRNGGTVDSNMEEIRGLLGGAAPEKRMEFEIRGPAGGPYKINKKGDGQYRVLMKFPTTSQAREAIEDDYASLVAAWEAIKDRDNITERDLRTADNRPRAGKDWRQGKDATPEQFQEAFGFKGGEFGKWVQQGKGDKERQAILNSAYDALMDLAQIAGVPPRAISLNGTLGIAFGSRGSGWASAHFEPSNLVINLTKTRGAGALAHEWLHALDNYFGRMRRGGEEAPFTGSQSSYRDDNYITHRPERLMVRKDATGWPAMTQGKLEAMRKAHPGAVQYSSDRWVPDPKHPDGVRPEVERRFADLVAALNASPMVKRARLLDGIKSGDGYWSRTLELAARAFENFVQARMREDGYHNDFLANVRGAEDVGKNPDRYPYLLPGEEKPIHDAFAALFDTIQTRTDDAGNVAMYSRTNSASLEAGDAVGREFWRKIDNGESFTDQEVLDALSINRRGSRRDARSMLAVADQAGTGQAVVGWQGDLAGFGAYTSRASWDGDNFNIFFVPDSLAAGADLNDDAQARDKALVHVSFKSAGGGKYELSFNDPQPGTTAKQAAEKAGIADVAGTAEKRYIQIDLSGGDVAVKAIIQESARRLALNIGRAPEVMYVGRDTGARAGKNTGPVEYSADTLRDKFSQTMADPITEPQARAAVAATFGDKNARAMLDGGLIEFVTGRDFAGATFSDGRIQINLSNVSRENIGGILKHEAFHSAVREWIGPDSYDALMARLESLRKIGAASKSPLFAKAAAAIPADTPASLMNEEFAGYSIEMAESLPPKSSIAKWVSDFMSAIRVAIIKRMPGGKIKAWALLNIKAEDLSRMAVSAMRARGTALRQDDGVMALSRPYGDEGIEATASDIRYSRTAKPDWITSGSAALQGAAGKIDTYAPTKTIAEKVRAMSVGWKQKLVQGMFDAYAPLKSLSMDAYIAARMTKAADGAFEGMLMYGKPVMTADGGITGDLDGKGFLGAMRELNGEHDRFFMWLAGNRAERLMAEGKENLFKADEIAAMKALNGGTLPDGSPRTVAFKRALDQFNAYSKSVLDVAEKAGLIDGESRSLWEHDFYVPFYRMSQENEISGPTKIKGLVRQKAFERLKGGKENLGDLMDNTLRNWSHLLSASLANVAASKSLLAAEQAGIAFEAKEAEAKEMAKAAGLKGNATYFMDQGLQRWFVVEDPAVLAAISSMEAPALNGLPLQLMAKFKKYLTVGVTISPAFKVRNLIRDTLAAPGANEMSFNLAKNLAQGWKATDTKTSGYAQMLFSGGLMRFGTYLEGDRAENVKRLIADGVDDKTILNTPQKVKAMLGKAWDAWQDFGDRMENVNRTALYQQLLDKGLTPREAAYQARDMMDFSLQGSWAAMRTLTAVVPFLNARAQGLYKLGRSAVENPKRMGYMVAAVSLASIMLMLAYEDDDDWKAREDWDRDAWWWFKIGDTAYRIPKPFEIGAMGTIAERSLELAISDEMTGARFAERMKQMVTGTFAINPVPQMFKPMLDLYANTDSFTGRQIETLGMERLSKSERYGPNTSALAKALGSAGDYTGVSPVQVDHMIRAYFGWLGTMGAVTIDAATSPFSDIEKPAKKIDDYFGGFVKELPSASSRYLEDFYKQAQATSEVMADLRRAREVGDIDKATEIMEERGNMVAQYRVYQQAQRQLADINKRISLLRSSPGIDADTKRMRLDELSNLRNQLARRVSDQTRAREEALQ